MLLGVVIAKQHSFAIAIIQQVVSNHIFSDPICAPPRHVQFPTIPPPLPFTARLRYRSTVNARWMLPSDVSIKQLLPHTNFCFFFLTSSASSSSFHPPFIFTTSTQDSLHHSSLPPSTACCPPSLSQALNTNRSVTSQPGSQPQTCRQLLSRLLSFRTSTACRHASPLPHTEH
jgi:hypothetical protein